MYNHLDLKIRPMVLVEKKCWTTHLKNKHKIIFKKCMWPDTKMEIKYEYFIISLDNSDKCPEQICGLYEETLYSGTKVYIYNLYN